MGNQHQSTDVPHADFLERPTRARYGVLAFLCALTFILYLDRVCINQAQTTIQDELRITNSQMGWVHWVFLLAYGLFEVPVGRWGDRYGSRGVLMGVVLWWSVFTAVTGAASGLMMLLIVRFLFGAGEAGALPNTARVLKNWFPAESLGKAQGLTTTSMLLGSVFAPFAAEKLIQIVGWRWSFVVFGSLGVVWAVAFYGWFRDNPSEHPAVNDAERQLISDGLSSAGHGDSHPPVPWGLVLSSPNVLFMSLVLACASFNSYIYYFWYSTYLQRGRGVLPERASILTGVVLAGGALGCILGGFLNDWLVRRVGNLRWNRRMTGCSGFAIASGALFASIFCDSPLAAALCTSLAFCVANIQLVTWWRTASEISGKHVGALFGLMNMVAVIGGGGSSQLIIGTWTDRLKELGYAGREQWDPIFSLQAGILLFGALGWLFIDATRPIEKDENVKMTG